MSDNLKTRIKALEKRKAANPPPIQVVIMRGNGMVEIDFGEVITEEEYYRRYPDEAGDIDSHTYPKSKVVRFFLAEHSKGSF